MKSMAHSEYSSHYVHRLEQLYENEKNAHISVLRKYAVLEERYRQLDREYTSLCTRLATTSASDTLSDASNSSSSPLIASSQVIDLTASSPRVNGDRTGNVSMSTCASKRISLEANSDSICGPTRTNATLRDGERVSNITPHPIVDISERQENAVLVSPQRSAYRTRSVTEQEEASLALALVLQLEESSAAFGEYEPQTRYAMTASMMIAGLAPNHNNVDPDAMTYEELLELGERVGDVKKDRWRRKAPSIIARLPSYRWSPLMDHTSCIICQHHFELNDLALTLPCTHVFHSSCVQEWLLENCACPLCKVEIE